MPRRRAKVALDRWTEGVRDVLCMCVCVCVCVARYTCRERERERERERNDCTYYTRVSNATRTRNRPSGIHSAPARWLDARTRSLPLVIQREWPRHQTRDDTAAGRPGQTEVGQRSPETTGCFVTSDRRGPLRTLATALRLVIAQPAWNCNPSRMGVDFLLREESGFERLLIAELWIVKLISSVDQVAFKFIYILYLYSYLRF